MDFAILLILFLCLLIHLLKKVVAFMALFTGNSAAVVEIKLVKQVVLLHPKGVRLAYLS